MENTKYIEEVIQRFDEKFSIINEGSDGNIYLRLKDDIGGITSFFESEISQALEHGYTQGKKDTVEEVVKEIEIFRFSVPVGEGTFTTLYCPDCKEQVFSCKQCLANSLKDKLLAKKEINN